MVLGKGAEGTAWESWTLPWEIALTVLRKLVFYSLSHKPWAEGRKDGKYRVREEAMLGVCVCNVRNEIRH